MFFDYSHVAFRYDPYPIGLAKPVIDPLLYQKFTERFPSTDIMMDYAELGKPGQKFTLSEKENNKAYMKFIKSEPLWRDFHGWIKSDAFIFGVLDLLKRHDIDLGFRQVSRKKRLLRGMKQALRGRALPRVPRLSARFEFSALPADGGTVVPHTDAPSKIVTMVVAIADEGEWDRAFGGGLDVNRPRSDHLRYNKMNRLAAFEEMEIAHTYEFDPNQMVIFVKTYDSWHSVRPMTGRSSQALRRTLTIVIETDS